MISNFADGLEGKMFYYHPQNGHDKNGRPVYDMGRAVAAKVLFINGSAIPDPNANQSNIPNLYAKLDGHGEIDPSSILTGQYKEAVQNYLLVPANYSVSEAQAYAAEINRMSLHDGVLAMKRDFSDGGSQDLQRGEQWGVPEGEVGGAFRDAASWELGFVTEETHFPNIAAEVGAGHLAWKNYRARLGKKENPAKPDGPFGMGSANYNEFMAGIDAAKAAGRQDGVVRYFRQLRDNIRAAAQPKAKTLHDLALSLGQTGQRSYAPIGRMAPFRQSVAPPRAMHGIAPALHSRQQSGTAGAAFAPGGQPQAETSFKAVLAKAKAEVARAQARAALAANAGYRPAGGALEHISFAPIGAPGLGPAARFAARAGTTANAGLLTAGTAASIGSETLMPAHNQGNAPAGNAPHGMSAAPPTPDAQADFAQALERYVFQHSRLPPASGAAFNPLLSPAWAGLGLPG